MAKWSELIQEYATSTNIISMKNWCDVKNINYNNFRIAYHRFTNVTNVTNVTKSSKKNVILESFQQYISTRTKQKMLTTDYEKNRHLINELFRLVTEYNRNS